MIKLLDSNIDVLLILDNIWLSFILISVYQMFTISITVFDFCSKLKMLSFVKVILIFFYLILQRVFFCYLHKIYKFYKPINSSKFSIQKNRIHCWNFMCIKKTYKILIKFQKLAKLEAKITQKVNWNCLDIVILCWSMEIKKMGNEGKNSFE